MVTRQMRRRIDTRRCPGLNRTVVMRTVEIVRVHSGSGKVCRKGQETRSHCNLITDVQTVKHGVFISYRRADAFFAARLRDRIEAFFPGRVFIDVVGIEPGSDFVTRLDTVLASCPVLVAVIGNKWLTSTDGNTRLGEPDDFVTREIGTALEKGVVVIPVLVEGATFPSTKDLPGQLKALGRRNALSVSHARFDTDVQYLIDAMYAPLGLRPKTRLEKIFEAFGTGHQFDERTRDWLAIGSVAAAAVGLLFGALWVWLDGLSGISEDLATGLGLSFLGVLLGVLGLNSARRRKLAFLGIALAVILALSTITAGVMGGLFFAEDPWLESLAIATANSSSREIPADQIRWSNRSPISGSLPTTVCPCLQFVAMPTGKRPFPPDTVAVFENECSVNVTFWVARATLPGIDGPYLFVEGVGREHAVVTLLPGQTVRLPMDGMYAEAALPWRCENQ